MPWPLIKHAESCENVAGRLRWSESIRNKCLYQAKSTDERHRYQDELPQCSVDISSLITRFNLVATSLRVLDVPLNISRRRDAAEVVADDLNLVLGSLSGSVALLVDLFREDRRLVRQGTLSCARLWDNFNRHVQNAERLSMLERVDWYHKVLKHSIAKANR